MNLSQQFPAQKLAEAIIVIGNFLNESGFGVKAVQIDGLIVEHSTHGAWTNIKGGVYFSLAINLPEGRTYEDARCAVLIALDNFGFSQHKPEIKPSTATTPHNGMIEITAVIPPSYFELPEELSQ